MKSRVARKIKRGGRKENACHAEARGVRRNVMRVHAEVQGSGEFKYKITQRCRGRRGIANAISRGGAGNPEECECEITQRCRGHGGTGCDGSRSGAGCDYSRTPRSHTPSPEQIIRSTRNYCALPERSRRAGLKDLRSTCFRDGFHSCIQPTLASRSNGR